MIEAVPERLEGAPRQFRRRWSDDIRHNYLTGVVMLVPD
jgi:hypothetical protein